jgi:hypothetical protein
MPEKEAQHLASGVPTGAGDGNPDPIHMHDYTELCMFLCCRVRKPLAVVGADP